MSEKSETQFEFLTRLDALVLGLHDDTKKLLKVAGFTGFSCFAGLENVEELLESVKDSVRAIHENSTEHNSLQDLLKGKSPSEFELSKAQTSSLRFIFKKIQAVRDDPEETKKFLSPAVAVAAAAAPAGPAANITMKKSVKRPMTQSTQDQGSPSSFSISTSQGTSSKKQTRKRMPTGTPLIEKTLVYLNDIVSAIPANLQRIAEFTTDDMRSITSSPDGTPRWRITCPVKNCSAELTTSCITNRIKTGSLKVHLQSQHDLSLVKSEHSSDESSFNTPSRSSIQTATPTESDTNQTETIESNATTSTSTGAGTTQDLSKLKINKDIATASEILYRIAVAAGDDSLGEFEIIDAEPIMIIKCENGKIYYKFKNELNSVDINYISAGTLRETSVQELKISGYEMENVVENVNVIELQAEEEVEVE